MKEHRVIYEPHPVTPERKKELRDQGFKIIDAIYSPTGYPGVADGDAVVPLSDGPVEFSAGIPLPSDAPPQNGEGESVAEVHAPQVSAAHPFDHDGDGAPGGSRPAKDRGLDDLRAQLQALGVKPDNRWGEKRLLEEIAKAEANPQQAAAPAE